jgi:hypothetical protein
MLFEGKDGTLNSLAQLLKACGFQVTAGEIDVPNNDELEGKNLIVRGTKVLAGYDKKRDREVNEYFRVDGFKAAPKVGSQKPGDSSLLP